MNPPMVCAVINPTSQRASIMTASVHSMFLPPFAIERRSEIKSDRGDGSERTSGRGDANRYPAQAASARQSDDQQNRIQDDLCIQQRASPAHVKQVIADLAPGMHAAGCK